MLRYNLTGPKGKPVGEGRHDVARAAERLPDLPCWDEEQHVPAGDDPGGG